MNQLRAALLHRIWDGCPAQVGPAPHLWTPLSLQQERSRKLGVQAFLWYPILLGCWGWVWGGGHKRGKGKRRGKALSGFTLQISQPSFTHLYGREAWLNRSISPQRAVNHTLSNAERWLQAPSAFIINHWDRKDMSLHLQSHRSSNCGHILPKTISLISPQHVDFLGQAQRSCSLGQYLQVLGKFSWHDPYIKIFLNAGIFQPPLKLSLLVSTPPRHPLMSYGVFTSRPAL